MAMTRECNASQAGIWMELEIRAFTLDEIDKPDLLAVAQTRP